jgi:formylglycine-generating enzyme
MFGKAIGRGLLAVAMVYWAVLAQADVFHMGTGLTSLETVSVGNPGNAADTAAHSGNSAGQGAVAYNYLVGKYEVTAGQYTEFLNAVAKTDTYGLYAISMWNDGDGCKIQQFNASGNYTYSVALDYANRPVNFVSFWDACRFTNWLHNNQPTGAQGEGTTETGAYTLNGYNGSDGRTIQRNAGAKWVVTSENEWYKAAYFKGGSTNAGYWKYPTNSDTAPGRDMADVSGNNANWGGGMTPYPIDSGKYTTIVGEFQDSDSPYGTFDQGGNVREWNETVFVYGSPYEWVSRGQRGGKFSDQSYDLSSNLRNYDNPANSFSFLGFRVASVPEPGSLVLLAGIALAALLCQWRKRP